MKIEDKSGMVLDYELSIYGCNATMQPPQSTKRVWYTYKYLLSTRYYQDIVVEWGESAEEVFLSLKKNKGLRGMINIKKIEEIR